MEFKKYERRIAKTAYWAVIAAALAYEGLIAFSDKVKSEHSKKK